MRHRRAVPRRQRRKNPVKIGSHPDLFKPHETAIVAQWNEIPRKQLHDVAEEGLLPPKDWAQIKAEDPDLYDELWELEEYERDERVRRIIEALDSYGQGVYEDYSGQFSLDSAEEDLKYHLENADLGELYDAAVDLVPELADVLNEEDAEQIDHLLRDPDYVGVSIQSYPSGKKIAAYEIGEIEHYVEVDYLYDADLQEDLLKVHSDEEIEEIKKKIDYTLGSNFTVKELQSKYPAFYMYVNIYEYVVYVYNDAMETALEEYVREREEEGDIEAVMAEQAESEGLVPDPDTDDVVHEFKDGSYVARLSPAEMIVEGDTQGMCIGAPDGEHDYRRTVREGEAMTFSLRTENGRPKLTVYALLWHGGGFPHPFSDLPGTPTQLRHLLEMDWEGFEELVADSDLSEKTGLTHKELLKKAKAFQRAFIAGSQGEKPDPMDLLEGIEQIKGKGNRLPGFDQGNHGELVHADEVEKISAFLKGIGIGPRTVSDLRPGYDALDAWKKKQAEIARMKKAGKEPEATLLEVVEDSAERLTWLVDFYPGLSPDVGVAGHPARYALVISSLNPRYGRFETSVYRSDKKGNRREETPMWSGLSYDHPRKFIEDAGHLRGYKLVEKKPRKNPASIRVGSRLRKLAEKAYNRPFGGEW